MTSPIETRMDSALRDIESGLAPSELIAWKRQHSVGGYHCDFLIEFVADGRPCVQFVVECDGHDWHERTPQQASYDRARDRDLICAGLVVIRFTGSDIVRDAEQCAREILRVARALASQRSRSVRPAVAVAATEDDREKVIRKRIIDEIHRCPARNLSTIVSRIYGYRREVVSRVARQMYDQGDLVGVGEFIVLSPAARAEVAN